MQKTQRLSHLDLLKIIAMLLVCISHVYQRTVPGATKTLVFGLFYSVHMALFMFVGGYLIKRCDKLLDLGKYFLKMFVYYLYPAVLFTILTVISMSRYANHDVIYWLNEFYVRTDTFYWYAISAIIINAFLATGYYIANKIFGKNNFVFDLLKNIFTLGLLAIFVLPVISVFKSETPGLLASNLTIEFLPPAVFGFLMRSFGKYIKQSKISISVELFVFVACLTGYIIALTHFKGWLAKDTYKLLFLHQLGSLAGVYVYYVVAKYLCKIKAISTLSVYGKYSYPLYLVHVYLIRVITPYVSRIEQIDFYSISFVVIYALVFSFGSLVVTMALTKNKFVNLLLFGDYKAFKGI